MVKRNQMRPSTNSILLCLDLEKGSKELAEFCRDCAARWDYAVHVIHIQGGGGRAIKDIEADLHGIVDEISSDVPAQVLTIHNETPEEGIIEYAKEKIGNPIIMLGRRKRRIADRIYVGSTTSAVISLSPYPVLVVPLNS